MTRVGALWIGGLEPYMDENFLNNAMIQMGQDGVVSIKVMNNKFTGEPAGYGFINFETDQKAIYVMHRLGGKVIPNSNPPVRFKLNHNSTRLQPGETDTSIWVGDLTPEVDDFALYQYFTQRYQTVRCAKVVLDEQGCSKGYGFVRFGSESEQQHALAHMTGELGLGSKPIKVSLANQKNRSGGGAGANILGGAAAVLGMGGPAMLGNGTSGGRGMPAAAGGPIGWGIVDHSSSGPPRDHAAAAAAGWPAHAAAGGGWPGGHPGAGPSGAAAAALGPPGAAGAPPGPSAQEMSAYQQYYQQQYAQQQQFPQQHYAAWNHAWQQQQQP